MMKIKLVNIYDTMKIMEMDFLIKLTFLIMFHDNAGRIFLKKCFGIHGLLKTQPWYQIININQQAMRIKLFNYSKLKTLFCGNTKEIRILFHYYTRRNHAKLYCQWQASFIFILFNKLFTPSFVIDNIIVISIISIHIYA